ncbi:MAG TPA: pyridoxamine 5'-phosphate oxidase family protein [Zeimonas sp.]
MSDDDTTPDARDRIRALIASNRVMTLASTGAGGPWVAPVFYAERFEADTRPWLVFVSSPSSRHVAELAADPRAAAAIHGDASDWRTLRGVQIAGRVQALEGDALHTARGAYATKFPQIGDPAQAPEAIARAFARVRWFALRAERIFLTDNAVSFGSREEIVYARAGD